MSHPLNRDVAREQEREQARYDRRFREQLRSDVQKVLATTEGRRLVFTFLQTMNIDATPFNTNAMSQSHGIGLQDAARWWLNVIRDHCPEREAQMRAEANKAAKLPPTTEEPADE